MSNVLVVLVDQWQATHRRALGRETEMSLDMR